VVALRYSSRLTGRWGPVGPLLLLSRPERPRKGSNIMEEAHKFSSHLPSLFSLPFRFFPPQRWIPSQGRGRRERRSTRAGYHPSCRPAFSYEIFRGRSLEKRKEREEMVEIGKKWEKGSIPGGPVGNVLRNFYGKYTHTYTEQKYSKSCLVRIVRIISSSRRNDFVSRYAPDTIYDVKYPH